MVSIHPLLGETIPKARAGSLVGRDRDSGADGYPLVHVILIGILILL